MHSKRILFPAAVFLSGFLFFCDFVSYAENKKTSPEGDTPAPNQLIQKNSIPDRPYIYPNPYRPDSGGDFDKHLLTFANLSETDKIIIYNLAGENIDTIREEPQGGKIDWDPKNRAGRRLASGVYIYHIIYTNGDIKSGKFSIIY